MIASIFAAAGLKPTKNHSNSKMSDYTYTVHCQALLDGIPLPAYSAPGSGSGASAPSAAPAPAPVASPIVRGAPVAPTPAPASGGK